VLPPSVSNILLFLSLRSFSSCLCLFLRLPVTSILPFTYPTLTCFRRQFLHKMWQIQLPSPPSLCNISSFLSRSDRLIYSLLPQHITKLSTVMKSALCSCTSCTPFLRQKAVFWIAVVRSWSNRDNDRIGGGGGRKTGGDFWVTGEQGTRYQHYWSVIICNKQIKKAQYW